MKRKPNITYWCGQHHRNTYADRNGKVHMRSSTARMTVCVYCDTPRWRYPSRQDLCEKCGRLSAERGQAGMRRNSHNDRVTQISRSQSKPADL